LPYIILIALVSLPDTQSGFPTTFDNATKILRLRQKNRTLHQIWPLRDDYLQLKLQLQQVFCCICTSM
jgi:hypothetical protein